MRDGAGLGLLSLAQNAFRPSTRGTLAVNLRYTKRSIMGFRRMLGGVAMALVLASACEAATEQSGRSSPSASQSPFTGNAVERAGMDAALGWDGVENRTMLAANLSDKSTRLTNIAVWTLNSAGWQPMTAPDVVADDLGFDSINLAYDSVRHVELLIATPHSLPGNAVLAEWNGRAWRTVVSDNAPTQLLYGAFSPELREWVGISYGQMEHDQTWLYDGTGWRRAAGVFESLYGPASVAYDPKRHAVVALESYNLESRQFDGSAWKEMQVAPPVPSSQGAITFDPERERWLMFGGFSGTAPTSETWIGGGASWSKLSPRASPPARFQLNSNHLSWDPLLGRAVLFGGIFRCCGSLYTDTWRWDGRNWTKLFSAAPLDNPSLLPTPAPCLPSSSSFGLLIAQGKLEAVDTCGKVVTSVPVAPPSVQACSLGGSAAVVEPPVSATKDKIFYRDGDTKIRSLSIDGTTEDVTSVPGGPSTVSMFSVSPDDQHLAVAVEDLSLADTINLRLYVEDLKDAGHHVDIYATSFSKQNGTTLWPMAWYHGLLLLAVMKACAADAATVAPVEWHLADPANGDRKFTVRDPGCTFGLWPSPAGDSCEMDGYIRVYDWTSTVVTMIPGLNARAGMPSGLSPSGRRAYYESSQAITCSGISPMDRLPPPGTCMVLEGNREVLAEQRTACLWIDEDHLLAPDAVIGLPSPTFPYARRAADHPLSASGVCAGRFPGSL